MRSEKAILKQAEKLKKLSKPELKKVLGSDGLTAITLLSYYLKRDSKLKDQDLRNFFDWVLQLQKTEL